MCSVWTADPLRPCHFCDASLLRACVIISFPRALIRENSPGTTEEEAAAVHMMEPPGDSPGDLEWTVDNVESVSPLTYTTDASVLNI